MPVFQKEPKFQKRRCYANIFDTAFLTEIYTVDTRKSSAIA